MIVANPPYSVIPEPEAPPLPGRRKPFTDPNFGTRLIQLTDATDGTLCRISYGIWPAFSCDGRKILIQCDSQFKIVTWDLASTWGDIALPASFQGADAIWSHTDPDLLYHRDGGSRLMALNVETGADLVIHDFSIDFPDSPFLARMSASEDDKTWCFARQTREYAWSGFCVYRVNEGIVFREPEARQGKYFKVQIDKSGRFVWNVALDPDSEYWNLSLPIAQHPVIRPGTGHSAMLSGQLAQYDNTNNQDVMLDFRGGRKVLLSWPDWTLATEYSGVAGGDRYAVTAAGQWPYVPGPLHDELLQVATDGSGKVWRICHLHNKLVAGDYDSIPQPACGYGAFPWIAFHSSWGDRARRDVFLAYTGGMQPVLTGSYPLNFIVAYAQDEPKEFSATVGGKAVAAGGPWQIPNGQWQLNVPVPSELIGTGETEVILTCDGVASEPMRVKV